MQSLTSHSFSIEALAALISTSRAYSSAEYKSQCEKIISAQNKLIDQRIYDDMIESCSILIEGYLDAHELEYTLPTGAFYYNAERDELVIQLAEETFCNEIFSYLHSVCDSVTNMYVEEIDVWEIVIYNFRAVEVEGGIVI